MWISSTQHFEGLEQDDTPNLRDSPPPIINKAKFMDNVQVYSLFALMWLYILLTFLKCFAI